MMPTLYEAKLWLDKLEPFVGLGRFGRNAGETKNIKIVLLEGEAVIALEEIISVLGGRQRDSPRRQQDRAAGRPP